MVNYKISSLEAPDGFDSPRPRAINDAGQVCGSALLEGEDPPIRERPVVWLGGAAQTLDVPGEVGVANDINEAGDVVGYLGSVEPDSSAFLHRNGTTSTLTGLPGPSSIALCINNNGLIAGTCGPTLGSRVFVYDSDQDALVETIEPLRGHATTSGGYINDDGHVVGISSNENGQDGRLFIRRNGSTEELGPATLVTGVAGINSSDMVVGSLRFGGIQKQMQGAFRYVPSGPHPGFQLCGLGNVGYGINEAGIVIGMYTGPTRRPSSGQTGEAAAFVHYPTGHPDAGFQDLTAAIANLAGWDALYAAYAINKNGSIAGWGMHNGSFSAFVLEPQPAQSPLQVVDHQILQLLWLFGGVEVDGGGWGLPPGGGPPVPIPPWGLRELLPAQRVLAIGRLTNHLATVVSNEKLSAEMRHLARDLIAAAAKELDKR